MLDTLSRRLNKLNKTIEIGLAKMRALGDEIGIPIELLILSSIPEPFNHVYGLEATLTGICREAIQCITAAA
ncbi:hypothetical protein PanWU01x14_263350 [Parasponia andersonii]|uniref:Uncharacterized protein n=1 Tax=Parasponia andersonii TaxID=3476 RepID=A0A2P5B7T9_PARAD|nr:hypothetical protein PanWU01x14_263350 [Parasponia andersonii]